MKKKKIVKVQKYTIEIVHFDDGTIGMNRNNEGFNVFELIGLCEFTIKDLIHRFEKGIKPDTVKTKCIKHE